MTQCTSKSSPKCWSINRFPNKPWVLRACRTQAISPFPTVSSTRWENFLPFSSDLTLSQTTNFRLFKTERVCRRQFQIWRKWHKVIQTGRKHCGTKRNCSLRAISPCPTVFSKGLFPRDVKRCHCEGMGWNYRLQTLSSWKSLNLSFGKGFKYILFTNRLIREVDRAYEKKKIQR